MVSDTNPRRYHHGDLRSALLEAAEKSARRFGVAQLSLRNLARDVGVSHAAPRRHFPERQDLLDALAESGYIRLGERIRKAVKGNGDFAVRVQQSASAFARFATENPELLELMNATKHRPGASNVSQAAEKAFEPILNLIREGQDRKLLRGGPPESIGIILYATMNGITTLVNTGAVSAEQIDGLTESAVDQFLRGAAP